MKKLNKISMTILAIIALVSSNGIADELFFKDTFNNSDGELINASSYKYGRQFGTKAPMNYYVTAAQYEIAGGKVSVTDGAGGIIQSLYDFTDSLNFNLECDMSFPEPIGGDKYSSIGICKSAAHQFAWDGFSINFLQNGSYRMSRGDASPAATWLYASAAGLINNPFNVKICTRAANFSGGKVSFAMYINDVPMPFDSDGGNVLKLVYSA